MASKTFNNIQIMKGFLHDALDARLDEMLGLDSLAEKPLKEDIREDGFAADFTQMSEDEYNAVIHLKELGRHFAGDQGAYADGCLFMVFRNRKAVIDYTDALEDEDAVMDYEIEISRDDAIAGVNTDLEIDIDDVILDGTGIEFEVYVYLNPDIVSYAPVEIEVDDSFVPGEDSGAVLNEVRRRIKVNFRGKRKIKMQCRPGFRWDIDKRTCIKITGADVAKKRKSMRRAVRTKKAQGQGFKTRVLRKTRKAMRFRKSMGLK